MSERTTPTPETAPSVHYEEYTLPNGLRVVLHHDPLRTVAAVNVLYRVGSKHDPPGRSGMAHLFEHLMFAGSEHVPNFDDALQLAGGENNAVTGPDYTLYYETLPAQNVETALWLEADRMRALDINAKSLTTQQKVVIEEFKETCLEEPYGDLYHHLGELIYTVHPYRRPVIGERFEHIRDVTLAEVREFYERYYRPDNAILVVAGGFNAGRIRGEVERHFGGLAKEAKRQGGDRSAKEAKWHGEPPQTAHRLKTVRADVPSPVIYLNYRTPGRLDPQFPTLDVLCFLLGAGRGSYLHRRLVRDGDLFTEVSAGQTDALEHGGIFVEAHPAEDADFAAAHRALHAAIAEFRERGVTPEQLQKAKARLEHDNQYRRLSISGLAGQLSLFTLFGDPGLINEELPRYLSVTTEDVNGAAKHYLRGEVLSELHYLPEADD